MTHTVKVDGVNKYEVAVEILHRTPGDKGAVLVTSDNSQTKEWIPLSVIGEDYTGTLEAGQTCTIFLDEYWATEKNFI